MNIVKMAFKNNYLFDYLGNILAVKSWKLYDQHINDQDFESSFSCFMVLRYLSMSANYKVRDFIIKNQYILQSMSQKNLYKFLLKNIDKQKSNFIKYIK